MQSSNQGLFTFHSTVRRMTLPGFVAMILIVLPSYTIPTGIYMHMIFIHNFLIRMYIDGAKSQSVDCMLSPFLNGVKRFLQEITVYSVFKSGGVPKESHTHESLGNFEIFSRVGLVEFQNRACLVGRLLNHSLPPSPNFIIQSPQTKTRNFTRTISTGVTKPTTSY